MTNLTEQNFLTETQGVSMPILIEFSSKSGLPDDLTQAYQNRCKFCHVDVDAQAAFANQFNLLHLPTSILMRDGQIVQRISGARSSDEWKKILNFD